PLPGRYSASPDGATAAPRCRAAAAAPVLCRRARVALPGSSSSRTRSWLLVGRRGERSRGERAAVVLGQRLDATLGIFQIASAVARERHAFFEDLQRFLQRQVARLERGDDLLQPRQALLKLEVGHRLP